MAGRKSKRAQAQKAGPEPATQPKKPPTARAQAQDQPRAKKQQTNQQPKPAVENTNPSGAKAKPGDKTGGKTRRPQNKRQRNNKATKPPVAQATAKLPLPDGYVLKKPQPKTNIKGISQAIQPPTAQGAAKLPLPEGHTTKKPQSRNKNRHNRQENPHKMAPTSSEPGAVNLEPSRIDATYVSTLAPLPFIHRPVSVVLTGRAPNTARDVEGQLLRIQSQPCLALYGWKESSERGQERIPEGRSRQASLVPVEGSGSPKTAPQALEARPNVVVQGHPACSCDQGPGIRWALCGGEFRPSGG